jgi:hypothetical protein
MPPTEQFDFLLEHGDRYALLGSGERVQPDKAGMPADEGIHIVAGMAKLGGPEVIGRLPGRSGAQVDRSGRWLGVGAGESEMHLYDADGLRPGFRFQASGLIHPHGDLIAVRDGDDLHLHAPDGHVLQSARFPRSREWWADEKFEFSACGEYLWHVATPADGKAALVLLRCPSLEVCDSRPPTEYSSWGELLTSVNSATGHLAVCRQAGDSFLFVEFYGIRKSKIRHQRARAHRRDGGVDSPLNEEPIFAPGGKRFLLQVSYGDLHEYSFPDCQHLASIWETLLCKERGDDHPRIDSFGYFGPLVLARLGDEILALRSGDLVPSPLPVRWGGYPLSNGLLVSSDRRRAKIARYQLTRRPFPVAAALDSKSTRAVAVYRRVGPGWHDITAEVGWLETNFTVARE